MCPPEYPESPGYLLAGDRVEARVAESPDAYADFSERLLRSFMALCENPRTRPRMLKMVKTSVDHTRTGKAMFRMMNRTVVHPAARATGVEASALRLELVCGQLVGLAMMRYVLRLEPLHSAEIDEIVLRFAPAIRSTLGA